MTIPQYKWPAQYVYLPYLLYCFCNARFLSTDSTLGEYHMYQEGCYHYFTATVEPNHSLLLLATVVIIISYYIILHCHLTNVYHQTLVTPIWWCEHQLHYIFSFFSPPTSIFLYRFFIFRSAIISHFDPLPPLHSSFLDGISSFGNDFIYIPYYDEFHQYLPF